MPKKNAASALADNLVRVLEAQRSLEAASYPLTLRRLAELTDVAADPAAVLKAAANRKSFAARVVVVRPNDLNSPVALAEDADQLAASGVALEFLLNLLCTAADPLCDMARLKKELSTKFRKPFAVAFDRRIATGILPPGVSSLVANRRKALYLDRYPPPPPPPAPEVSLAMDLVDVLRKRPQDGDIPYPLSLERLVELTRPGADPKLAQKAFALPAFGSEVLIALAKQDKKQRMDSPVALTRDRDLLAGSPCLLEAVVRLSRTERTQIVSQTELQKRIAPPLVQQFGMALAQRVESRSLPESVGCLSERGKLKFFLVSDVRATQVAGGAVEVQPVSPPVRPTPPIAPSNAPTDFVQAFEEAFDRLDRQRGHNFVNLVDLRRALMTDRQSFDAGLQSLRRAGRYTLSAAEGRDGISPEENQAGIREEGSLLLYVSRRLS
jgi:hypothetical protein